MLRDDRTRDLASRPVERRSEGPPGSLGRRPVIMEGGPVETAFTVYSDFENYAGGIYHHVSGGMAGGHAVKFVGWGVDNGQKYWKVANSWNPYWGEKGYFRIVRGTNEGGIEHQVIGSVEERSEVFCEPDDVIGTGQGGDPARQLKVGHSPT